jgi:hypothetical protein
MAEGRPDRIAANFARINLGEEYEIRYWTRKWGVSKERLQEVIDKVGPSIRAVARELNQPE